MVRVPRFIEALQSSIYFRSNRSKNMYKQQHCEFNSLVPRKFPYHLLPSVITGFLGRLSLLSLLQQSEGNTLAATEFIRLLEASGSVTAKRSNGTREKTQLLGSNSRV